MKRRAPEHSLQRAVVDYLGAAIAPPGVARNGAMWHAIDHANARDARAGAERKGRGVIAGIPDLVLIRDGRLHCIELKAQRGALSVAQKHYCDQMKAVGVPYVVVRSLDDLAIVLMHWGVPLRCHLLPLIAADARRAKQHRQRAGEEAAA